MAKRRTPEQQLADLQQKEAQLKARIQKKSAEVAKQTRRQDTRRKIIAGALALEHMGQDEHFAATMRRLLNDHVNRPEDRKLFEVLGNRDVASSSATNLEPQAGTHSIE